MITRCSFTYHFTMLAWNWVLLVGVELYLRVILGRDELGLTCTNGSPFILGAGLNVVVGTNESGVLRSGFTMDGEPDSPLRRLGCSSVGRLLDGGTVRL